MDPFTNLGAPVTLRITGPENQEDRLFPLLIGKYQPGGDSYAIAGYKRSQHNYVVNLYKIDSNGATEIDDESMQLKGFCSSDSYPFVFLEDESLVVRDIDLNKEEYTGEKEYNLGGLIESESNLVHFEGNFVMFVGIRNGLTKKSVILFNLDMSDNNPLGAITRSFKLLVDNVQVDVN